MEHSRIRWTAMFALVFALGLSACGGDANGDASEDAAAAADAAVVNMAVADEVAAEADAEVVEQELPEGVTAEMVEQGKAVYGGAGICSSCHGPAGAGIPSLGANLTDAEWVHSDGSYEEIVTTILEGVTAQESSSGVPMPAKGGTNISDDDVKAVAAYVWTLGQ